jgi:hypothetical protein
MKPACSVDEQVVKAARPRRLIGIEGHSRRVRPLFMAYDIASDSVTPNLQLLCGCCTKSVSCGKHHPVPLTHEHRCDLSYRCGLACSVYSHYHDHGRRLAGLCKRHGLCTQYGDKLLLYQGNRSVGIEPLSSRTTFT